MSDHSIPTGESYETGYLEPETPYYYGSEALVTAAKVGDPIAGQFQCSIDGRFFALDREIKEWQDGGSTIPLLRNQIDSSQDPGEQSINREELWRRSRETWFHGAGQFYADRADATEVSNPARFWASKGINPWTRWQLSLLRDTVLASPRSGTNLAMRRVGDRLYVIDGTGLTQGTDVATSTAVTGLTGTPTAMSDDGFDLWVAAGGNIYYTTRGAPAATSYLSGTTPQFYYNVAWVRGRLVVADRQFLSEVTVPSGVVTATVLNSTFGNTDWTWTAITESTTRIYVAGYSGMTSQVFYIQPINNDPAQALGPPVPAGPPLPQGEVINTMIGYLGYLILGTNRGWRVAQEDSSGNLSMGSLAAIPGGVQALYGNDRFVWFTWSNYDGTSTGVGRIDLSVFPPENVTTPAYASDLMATAQGNVTSICSFGGKTMFAVSAVGIFAEADVCVPFGSIDVGRITYSMLDPKVAIRADIRQASTGGAVAVSLGNDADSVLQLGMLPFGGSVSQSLSFDALELAASFYKMEVDLIRSETDPATSPIIRQIQLRVYPAPNRGVVFSLPVRLDESNPRHPSDDYEFLTGLVNQKHTSVVQIGEKIRNVVAEDYAWVPTNQTANGRWFNGTLVMKMKEMAT